MLSVNKVLSYRQKSEGGFVLIAALMAVMILMAVGFFILTTTSQDLRMSSRLVGERKALSAAEAGVHYVCALLDPKALTSYQNVYYNLTNDPSARFSASGHACTAPCPPSLNKDTSNLSMPGYDLSKGWSSGPGFDVDVTGEDTSYKSLVTIGIGTVGPPNKYDLQYPD